MHLQEPLKEFGYKEGDFPAAEEASKQVLSLPCYPGMSENDIEKVSQVIIKCLKG
ncbi:pyridoxal phosphate-dependent enzyme [Candidatus Magnetoovum chiemensis]|nr:pyridoxal phosphate-dependent enzyme [Candidatus Magnetoovum chiemensis]